MTLKSNVPVDQSVGERTSVINTNSIDNSVAVYNCEAQTFVSSEFECPILNKVVKIEGGSCRERCEFAS